MKRNKDQKNALPKLDQLEAEYSRINYHKRFRKLLLNTLYTLIVVAACAVLCAVVFLPVLRIYGSSMTPTLSEGQIVVSIKGAEVEQGDVVAVYYGRKLLVKRCIATEHQWINIEEDGSVYVDNVLLDEPYITEKALGECNIELPYQVPDNCIFVMGDHRATSIDSRNTSLGCIDDENVVGRIILRVWPLKEFALLTNNEE